ncbi:hypothetical protein H206_00807 [Candidatus Electrothrix aarhusensis]|uniref:Uncharacterized protein n=1 Tax=Candidatus Electrothrix aarhusensis TaxID=1859131 RepID=A0A3S3U9J9_9BACT|nr:hypothetical protein H206_00807 [Candidatus Electrothrix aarhusensis]
MKLAAIILFTIFCTTEIAYSYDINAYCKSVSEVAGGSYQIEEACRKMEKQSKKNISKMTISKRIKKYCDEVGKVVGGSYQIMESCIKQELSAKGRL